MQAPVHLAALCTRAVGSNSTSILQRLLCSNALQLVLGASQGQSSTQSQHMSIPQPCPCTQTRQMGVWVRVQDNDLTSALRKLNRKLKDSGLLEELRWRQHHIRKSDLRFHARKQAWNNEMARRITQKLYWLRKRKYVSE